MSIKRIINAKVWPLPVPEHNLSISMFNSIKSRGVWILASIALVMALQGCGEKILDARNATISNGLVYAGDSDKPFTGKVTHIPDAKILLNQPGIRPFFQPLKAYYLDRNAALLDRLLLNASLCDIKVSNGVLDGEVVCKFPQSDAKRYEMAFTDGKLDGAITFYGPPPNNVPVLKGGFKQGALHGALEVYSVKTQKVVHRQTLKSGVNQGDVNAWDENTGNEIERATYADGKLEGQAVRYAPDGKTLTFRATYAGNLFNGTMETFDPVSGAPTLKSEWRAGKRNGIWKKWLDGKLIEDSVFQDDQLVSKIDTAMPVANDATVCESAWLAAHRKEIGPDATVSSDQLAEWQSWCREGRRPG
jgi:antitoxin component YwqK of YwqJK toxin-antitoxin module